MIREHFSHEGDHSSRSHTSSQSASRTSSKPSGSAHKKHEQIRTSKNDHSSKSSHSKHSSSSHHKHASHSDKKTIEKHRDGKHEVRMMSGSVSISAIPTDKKRKKAGEFVRDSIWAVGLPALPVSAKSLSYPFEKNRLLRPVAGALDLYMRLPLLPDPFYAVPADTIDPLAYAKSETMTSIEPADQRLLVDLAVRKSSRVRAQRLGQGDEMKEKVAPVLSQNPPPPSRVFVEPVEEEVPVENIEEFIYYVESSFVDPDELEENLRLPNGVSISAILPILPQEFSSNVVNACFDVPCSIDSSSQNFFLTHSGALDSTNNSGALYQQKDPSSEIMDAEWIGQYRFTASKSDEHSKQYFIVQDPEEDKAYVGEIFARYDLKKKLKLSKDVAVLNSLDAEMNNVPELIRFVPKVSTKE